MARLNLIDWHDVGQQPFASLARTRQQGDALIGEVQAWIGENYGWRSPVAAMAARSGLPERSFDRRFRKATGLSPLAYVHTLRLEEAKQQLEATRLPIEAVAANAATRMPATSAACSPGAWGSRRRTTGGASAACATGWPARNRPETCPCRSG